MVGTQLVLCWFGTPTRLISLVVAVANQLSYCGGRPILYKQQQLVAGVAVPFKTRQRAGTELETSNPGTWEPKLQFGCKTVCFAIYYVLCVCLQSFIWIDVYIVYIMVFKCVQFWIQDKHEYMILVLFLGKVPYSTTNLNRTIINCQQILR